MGGNNSEGGGGDGGIGRGRTRGQNKKQQPTSNLRGRGAHEGDVEQYEEGGNVNVGGDMQLVHEGGDEHYVYVGDGWDGGMGHWSENMRKNLKQQPTCPRPRSTR